MPTEMAQALAEACGSSYPLHLPNLAMQESMDAVMRGSWDCSVHGGRLGSLQGGWDASVCGGLLHSPKRDAPSLELAPQAAQKLAARLLHAPLASDDASHFAGGK